MHDLRAIGNRVRSLRLERDWSMREVADRAGVSLSYVSRLEGAQIAHPSVEHLGRIAAVFGITVDELRLGPRQLADREQEQRRRLDLAGYNLLDGLTPDELRSIREYVQFVRERKARDG